jgi:hypothetical protein
MSVAPPVLDIFVVWHPDELGGEDVFAQLDDHYHSPAFSGLAGGAVDVYGRSVAWAPGGAPRPFGIEAELAPGVAAAQYNVIVLYIGAGLAQAVLNDPDWERYVADIARLAERDNVIVLTLIRPKFSIANTRIGELVGGIQPLPRESLTDGGILGREVSQAITQWLTGEKQIQVFVSHTKHPSLVESDAHDGAWVYERVREAILTTRLEDFFDAQDIQSGEDWESVLDGNAQSSALLMVRTDTYAGREWTQREVFEAKAADMPIICMYALTDGEARGSFLMDHVPSVPCDLSDPMPGIKTALNRLVDEALKRALWHAQRVYLEDDGFDWLPVHAPEPVTLIRWLRRHQAADPEDRHVWVMHPDPPLGPREREVVTELCVLAGFDKSVDVLTPRTFATRGGVLPS